MGRFAVVPLAVLVSSLAFALPAALAAHNPDDLRSPDDLHSQNMRLVANYPGEQDSPARNGTDMAFWGDLAVVGKLNQSNTAPSQGGFRILDVSDPEHPRLIRRFDCQGDQSDVSIWKDILVLSVDAPTTFPNCGAAGASWEGVRIISIADPANPVVKAAVGTDCGSHTNTIYPDPGNDRLLVYVLSYPLAGRYNPAGEMIPHQHGTGDSAGCNAGQHGRISVVEVPFADPKAARVIAEPRISDPSKPGHHPIGCHDVTVFIERDLAAAACLTETQIWELDDPDNPTVIARIPNPPQFNISHSTVFSNDGRTLVIGDEMGGAAASPGCFSDRAYESGGLFFFDITGEKKRRPQQVGFFKIPQRRTDIFCTAHLFNVVPTHRSRDILVSSWYTGATSIIDFTDPSRPRQVAYYVPNGNQNPLLLPSPQTERTEAAAWASYWYNGYVWSSNFDEDVNSVFARSRGIDVFHVADPALRGALRLKRLNPQLQEPLRAAAARR